jgi:hypothetical protein
MERVTRALLRCALGEEEPVRHKPTSDAVSLAACAGRYRMDRSVERTLVVRDGTLAFDEPDGPVLSAIGDGHFCESKDPEIEYRFGDLQEGRYRSFRYFTPLFPHTDYARVAP